jgi:glycosyltransferase involved in cell wall biosynthesis
MPDEPLISIITPSFNQERFIEQTIQSVLGQNYPNIEYIIIDGGSTDGTGDIIKKYEQQLSYWVSEPDNGVSDAFNKGLRASRGDYIQFLNSDDWLIDSTIISRVIESIKQSDYPLLLYGNAEVVDRSNGEHLWYMGRPFTLRGFLLRMTIGHQALFTRKDYFERYGEFDSGLKYSMDYEMLLRSVPDLHPVWLNYTIVKMREGGISRRHKADAMLTNARVQVKHGVRSPFMAYLFSLIFIAGLSLRSLLEFFGIRISARF